MPRRLALLVIFAGSVACASTQTSRVATPDPQVADTSIFAPLTLPPAPSQTRLANGAPGPKYWQNRADYDLHATLDTAARVLRGAMTLRYTNHSPDTLGVLWFEVSGFRTDSIAQLLNGKPVPLTLQQDTRATEMKLAKVVLARPIGPGQSAVIQASWRKKVPEELKLLYESFYWYPIVCVYDDVSGWNLSGKEGIYADYGDLALALTVPAGYIVAATGTLVNPREVLTTSEITRLAQAATSATPVAIITENELRTGAARPTGTGMLTWRFHASRASSPAWAAAPNYQWDAAGWHGILIQSYYRPQGAATFGHGQAVDQARLSIQEYTEHWFPYPFPQYSVVEGPELGTTYEMVSFVGDFGTPKGEYSLIAHELGHTWFPYLTGSDEQMHLWMSEGFDTFISSFSGARRYPELSQDVRIRYPSRDRDAYVPLDSIIFPGADSVQGKRSRAAKVGASRLEADGVVDNIVAQYFKPPYALQLLRSEILGPAVFDKAFRTYIRRWAYKHATPQDFFRTMEDVSGQHLAWFWREFFLEAPRFGQAVDSVTQTVQGHETHVMVRYRNRGRAVLPLLVRFTFSDGTTQDVRHPVEVWRANSVSYTALYTFRNKTVRRIVLDPDARLPDPNGADNSWTAR